MLLVAYFCTKVLPWPKKIETTARTWHRRVICRACTRLCLACVPVSIFFGKGSTIYEPAHAKRGLMAFFVEFEISTVSDVELSQKYASENRFQKYQACTKLWSIK